MNSRLRMGVVGGGLIAQAVHLPNLARMAGEFELVAIADASSSVATGLAARYGSAAYTDWRALLDRETLDALLVCSPHATHAQVTLAALGCGVNVFVEKPMCISPQDARTICDRRQQTGLVVQVGYMKRFEPAYEAFLDGLPGSSDRLRLVTVVTYDPWMAREPFVPWNQMIQGEDIAVSVLDALQEAERDQVEAAVGRGDDGTVRAYSYTFLACLIHDVNLILGALDHLGVDEPLLPLMAAHWADGNGASIAAGLPNGATAQFAWVLLPGLLDFHEQATFYFEDAVHELRFPGPYDRDAAVHYSVTATQRSKPAHIIQDLKGDAFAAELSHFHDCVVDGSICRCPPEQAARDIELLRDLFVCGARADETLSKGASAR